MFRFKVTRDFDYHKKKLTLIVWEKSNMIRSYFEWMGKPNVEESFIKNLLIIKKNYTNWLTNLILYTKKLFIISNFDVFTIFLKRYRNYTFEYASRRTRHNFQNNFFHQIYIAYANSLRKHSNTNHWRIIHIFSPSKHLTRGDLMPFWPNISHTNLIYVHALPTGRQPHKGLVHYIDIDCTSINKTVLFFP